MVEQQADDEPRSGSVASGPAESRDPDSLSSTLLAARPDEPAPLEKRLAIASILQAAGSEPPKPQLGRLEVQARLGGGAMGVVYRAYDPDLARFVAVKLLRRGPSQQAHGQILEEARTLARLNHPNVVTVHDVVDGHDGFYLTMEYVPGVSLSAWLRDHGSASWREIVDWFAQAARGLAVAHGAGIVHRDVKPDNILVGDDGRVRVVDFGLAMVREMGGRRGSPSEPPPSSGGAKAGTPYYMAPETQADGTATAASDQYSLCKALIDALAGRDAPGIVRRAAAQGLADEPSARHPSMNTLVEVLEGALATSRGDRSRQLLLGRVERHWLHGVLDRSISEAGAIDLRLEPAPDLVEGIRVSRDHPPTSTRLGSNRELRQTLEDGDGSLLLVGEPGGGKTTVLLLLCRELWHAAVTNPEAPAPVVLSLGAFRAPKAGRSDAGAVLRRWVVDEMVTKYGLPRPSTERWLDNGAVVLLLDGLDEAKAADRRYLVDAIASFRQATGVAVTVTARESEYEAIGKRLAFGAAARLCPLDDRSVEQLLEEQRAAGLQEQLQGDPRLRAMLRNPLMLTLYAQGAERVGAAPDFDEAYARYVERCLARLPDGEAEVLRRQLTYLATVMQRRNSSDLWLERIGFRWLPGPWLPEAVRWSGVAVVVALMAGLGHLQVPLIGAPPHSTLTFSVGIPLATLAFTRARIQPTEQLRWSRKRALRLLPLSMLCASVIGITEALHNNFWGNLAGAAIMGLCFAAVFALEPAERETQVAPNAGIHQSLIHGVSVALLFAIPVGLFYGLVFEPFIYAPLAMNRHPGNHMLIIGVQMAVVSGTGAFLIYGGFSALMHWWLRLWLAATTPLPLNLGAMLGQGVAVGLLRQVGGGFVFMHRTLLDHFAEQRGSG